MQARWHDPTGAWQRFTVIESEHANKAEGLGGNNGPCIGVALLAHTGCYLEVIEEEGEEEEGKGNALLEAKVQRQTEYAPRPPTFAQTFVVVPALQAPHGSSATNEVCFQSLDGKWRIAAAYGKEPRPGVVLQRVNNNNSVDDDLIPPSCRWTVESPAAGLAPLRCGFVLPLHNYECDSANDTIYARSRSSMHSVCSSGSSSELVWFGCGPHESYLDRKAGASVGKWRGPVEQQTFR